MKRRESLKEEKYKRRKGYTITKESSISAASSKLLTEETDLHTV